jgi:GNAT superfamily N-acetyltransferase
MPVTYEWRGPLSNAEVDRLHAEAFAAPTPAATERDWVPQLDQHSLGWVVARDVGTLVGFVNVAWDGLAHAWLIDTMVSKAHRGTGIGRELVQMACHRAKEAGCQWLHADYEDDLRHFYEDVCGFAPTHAGLIALA